jgi:hypothetical protein
VWAVYVYVLEAAARIRFCIRFRAHARGVYNVSAIEEKLLGGFQCDLAGMLYVPCSFFFI